MAVFTLDAMAHLLSGSSYAFIITTSYTGVNKFVIFYC